MKKFTNKHSDVIIAIIFIIVIPTALFYSIAAIVKSNLFNLSFMESKDNFILYFATMFASGISATITFIVLKITLEKSREELEQQKKNLEEDYKRKLELKMTDIKQKNIQDAIDNCIEIKVIIMNLLSISDFLKVQAYYIEHMKEVRKYYYNLQLRTEKLTILNNRLINYLCENKDEFNEYFEAVKNSTALFLIDYKGVINNPSFCTLKKESKETSEIFINKYLDELEKLYSQK